MKVYQLLILLQAAATVSAFVLKGSVSLQVWSQVQPTYSALFAAELVAEPEDGEELTPLKTMEGARMKNMGVCEGVEGKDGPVYNFWLTAQANGKLISEFRAQIMKDASKKANFPGFRKVRCRNYV